MKKRRRGLWWKITLVVLLLLLTPFIVGGVYVGVTAVKLDASLDMALMETMRGSRTTRIYMPDESIPREELTLANYRPQELDIVYGNENMVWADSREIPEMLKQAFIAIEDRRFYTHRGVDVKRTAYAVLNYVFGFRDKFGGSTITQQLVKNVHGEADVSVSRKVKEIIRAVRVEKEYTKEEILTYYLNIVPLGNQLVGVRAAARYYFGKELDELALEECATLAAITNAPARFDPKTNPEENTRRRGLVLDAMVACGYLDEEQGEAAKTREIALYLEDPVYSNTSHNWYVETVIAEVIEDLQKQLQISYAAANTMLYRGGLEIYSLMDVHVQKEMEKSFENTSLFPQKDGVVMNGAMVIMHPQTGHILGVVGGVGDKTGNRVLNRATQAYYPPGSSLKPLSVYGPALEENLVHYGSAFEDIPTTSKTGVWPHNSPNVYDGRIPLHTAIAKSKNTVSVEVLKRLGKEKAYAYLQNRLHLSGLVQDKNGKTDMAIAPLALGQLSYGVTAKEMAAAFATFANGGEYVTPATYLAVYDRYGEPLLTKEIKRERVWSKESAYIMTKMLEEVVDTGTARRITLKEVVDTAGKTGTSGGDKDKWFVGYTPYYVGAIHTGYDDSSGMLPGDITHLTLWDEVMMGVHHRLLKETGEPKSFSPPTGILYLPFCRDSGEMPNDHCQLDIRGDRTEWGYFKTSNRPLEECHNHIEAHYDLLLEEYGVGAGNEETALSFSILSLPDRKVPDGVVPKDEEYTLEYLLRENKM